ncbi:hypothetical protein Tco_1047316 [Tanacetum coccineum]
MIEKKEIKLDEEPARGTLWLKGRVNKDGEYPDDEIRSVGDKLDKIKEGTLKVDHGTDAMTVLLGKEKGGYASGVGSGVTYKRYFYLPRSRQASDEKNLLLQTQLDNERREHQEKELIIQNLSNKMSPTKGMVSLVDINPINSSDDEEGGTTVVGLDAACIPDVGNNGLKTVKDGVGGFFAWPKNQVVLDEEVYTTNYETKDNYYNFRPCTKLQSKRKSYVSRETMQRQARTGKSHKSLNYGRKIPETPWGSPIPIGDGDGDVNRFPDGDGDGDGDEAEKRGYG